MPCNLPLGNLLAPADAISRPSRWPLADLDTLLEAVPIWKAVLAPVLIEIARVVPLQPSFLSATSIGPSPVLPPRDRTPASAEATGQMLTARPQPARCSRPPVSPRSEVGYPGVSTKWSMPSRQRTRQRCSDLDRRDRAVFLNPTLKSLTAISPDSPKKVSRRSYSSLTAGPFSWTARSPKRSCRFRVVGGLPRPPNEQP